MPKSYASMQRAEVQSSGDGKSGHPALVIINGDVLDVTKFAMIHPGGAKVLQDYAGQDATEVFYSLHRHETLEKYLPKLKKAEVAEYDRKLTPTAWKDLSMVPYAEVNMDDSPYYNESHKRFRLEVRRFLWEEGIVSWCEKAESSGKTPPTEIYQKLGRSGALALYLGVGPHLKNVPEPNLWSRAGIAVDDLDLYHWSILGEERARICCPGAEDGISSGISIGLGPILAFGKPWMEDAVIRPVLQGTKVICLAITEPYVGSDVASCHTTAKLSPDGSHYIVNGTKKWITNAVFADYFTTLVRTSDAKGAAGLSMMLIEKGEGVVVRKIPTEYSPSAGTGLISFENAKVPAMNLLGKAQMGMMITMHNFNMERLMICTGVVARCRRIVEETFLWANQRMAFGKSLLGQPVIRNHIGKMISELQSVTAFYQALTFKYQNTPHKHQRKLGGETAFLKYRCTRAATLIADLSVQVFGGRGITRTGMGKNVSRFQKAFKFASVYGGSEEIMLDLGVRQAMKVFPRNAKL